MTKNKNIELLRLISAFAIVWFHSGSPGKVYAYAGLITFAILSMYLAGISRKPEGATLRSRARRLLLPWAIWLLIYGAFNLALHRPFIALNNGWIMGLLAGTNIHLWYMPFIFFCLVIYDRIKPRSSPQAMAWGSAALSVVMLATAFIWRDPSLLFAAPLPQYLHVLAAAFIGIFFAFAHHLDKKYSTFLRLAIVAGAIAAVPYPGVGLTYLIAILLTFFMLRAWSTTWTPPDVSALSACTLGIYFIHPLFLSILGKYCPMEAPLYPIATFACSLLAVYACRRLAPKLAPYWS